MSRILLDTGFFKALIIPNDQHKAIAAEYETKFRNGYELCVLWPMIYEVLNAEGIDRIAEPKEFPLRKRFRELLAKCTRIDDTPYREEAITEILRNHHNELSLADAVLVKAVQNRELRIKTVITFDSGISSRLPPTMVPS